MTGSEEARVLAGFWESGVLRFLGEGWDCDLDWDFFLSAAAAARAPAIRVAKAEGGLDIVDLRWKCTEREEELGKNDDLGKGKDWRREETEKERGGGEISRREEHERRVSIN